MYDTALQFVIYGSLLSTAAYLVQRMVRASRQTNRSVMFPILGLILVILFFVLFAYMNAPPLTLGDTLWYNQSPATELWLFMVMVIGMAASYLTKQIDGRRILIAEKAKSGDRSFTPLEFDFWEFINPMLVSVITFGAVLQALGGKELDLASIILSFQTGFFWQTVLAKRAPM
jgi:hypothetical protein